MQLTADTFLEIVQSLRSDKSAGGLREQRRHPRVGVRGRAIIMVALKATPRMIAVNVRDLSAAGIGILVPEAALDKEDEFLLILPQGVRHAKRAVTCTVKRVGQLAESLYSIGAIFGTEVAAEKIPVVAAASAKPTTSYVTANGAKSKAATAARAPATPPSAARPTAAAAPAAAKPADSPAASPSSVPALPVSHGVSADLLAGADAEVVNALEARLRAMTD